MFTNECCILFTVCSFLSCIESAPCRHGVEESNKGADSLLVVNDLQNPHTYVSPEVRYESVRTAPDRVKTNAPPPAKLKEPITPIAESSVVGQESKELPVSCLEDLTLNDSIPPVTTYRSRKEKPEEYHPSGGGITVNSRPCKYHMSCTVHASHGL